MINFIENRQIALFHKNTFLKETIVVSTDNYKLSLRKRRIEEHLLLKRNIPQTNSNKLNSTISIFLMPNEATDSLLPYEDNTITQLIEKCSLIAHRIVKYLNDAKVLTLLLEHLNNILTLIPIESLSLLSSTKLIESLNALMVKHQTNHSLIYSVIASLIKCSLSTDNDFNDKLINVSFLQNYISLLVYLQKLPLSNLISHLMLFLGNIVSENEYIQDVFYSYRIFDLIAERLNEEGSNSTIKASIVFFACFASLKRFPCLDCAVKLKYIFSYFLDKAYCGIMNGVNISDNKEVLYTCLWGLFFVYFYQDNELISEENFSVDLIEDAIDSCDYLNKGYQLVLGMLGNITARSDNTICDRVYNEKIGTFIIKCMMENNDVSIRITSLWVTTNLSIGSNLRCLLQYDFYSNILSLMKEESDQKVLNEFIEFVIHCITHCEGNSLVEYEQLLNEELLTIIYDMMIKGQCNQMLLILFDSLCSLNLKTIIYSLKNIGVKDFLEKCNQMPNEEIQTHSNRLLERHFKEAP